MIQNKKIIWQMSRDYKPGVNPTTINIVMEDSFGGKYVAGFDDYETTFTPNQGLFAQVNKDIFEYNSRKGITKRDIVITYMHLFKEYRMPYSKNQVTTEEQLDIEVDHFYFLNKYNLL